MTHPEQAEVVAFLSRPASYPHHPPAVTRIDTHSASVFLAGDRAYKMKRAVRYSFLDFSTVDRRRDACEAELRLNQRTAPGIYRGVVAVTRDAAGALAIDGHGAPVEWLVAMRRFPEEGLLDRLAVEGALTPALVSRLADVVAEFHAHAAPAPHEGGAASMHEVVDDNTRALAAAPDALPDAEVRRLAEACRRALDAHGALLDARRAGGFVRQCHGDLHLRNIVLIDGAPTLFDAIEFNDAFACVDVWYDLAFLVMDLLARGLPSLANGLFNQYLLRTGDVGGLPLLPLYLATRAAVRAKTSLASAAIEEGEARRAHEQRAREYLSLAVRLATPVPPRLVAVGGLSGSGKSTLAISLAPTLGGAPGAVVLRSDVLRKLLLHRTPEERLGAEGYSADVTRRVYRALARRATDVLAQGWSVIADATFLDAAARDEVEAVARREAVPFHGLWLEAPAETMAARLRARTHDASDATADILERQLRADSGAVGWARLAAGGDREQVAREARRAITADAS